MECRMLRHYENRSAHNIVPRRTFHARYMGYGEEAFPCGWCSVLGLFGWLQTVCRTK